MEQADTLVYTAEGEFNAQQVKAFLEAHGIPCAFRGEVVRKTVAVTLDGLGYVEVHVPEELVARARELLADVEAGRLSLNDDDDPERR